MLVVTTENVPGQRVREVQGEVFGIIVRSRGIGPNIIAQLRSLAGGEIVEYTRLLEDARKHAIERMGDQRLRARRKCGGHDAVRQFRDRPSHVRNRGVRQGRCPRTGVRFAARDDHH